MVESEFKIEKNLFLGRNGVVKTRHVFVKHGCPGGNKVKIWQKSYILTPPQPQGHGMSGKCEEPIDEPTVQVWLLYHHQNFLYCTCTLYHNYQQTDKQTDRQMDGQMIKSLYAPGEPFRLGHKNKAVYSGHHIYKARTLNQVYNHVS